MHTSTNALFEVHAAIRGLDLLDIHAIVCVCVCGVYSFMHTGRAFTVSFRIVHAMVI